MLRAIHANGRLNVTEMNGKVVLVTGANSGIGKVTATALAKRGATVLIGARSRERGEAALRDIKAASGNEKVKLMLGDVSSLASVRSLAAQVLAEEPRLDVLVNNAGLLLGQRQVSVDGYELTFATNHLGPFLLTSLLLDRLRATGSARIVNVSSMAHMRAFSGMRFDDLQAERGYDAMETYGRSKLANILFTRELARRLAGTGVTANALHPGLVATRFAGDGDAPGLYGWFYAAFPFIMLTPERGATASIHLASAPEVAHVTGKFFIGRKPAWCAPWARNDAAAKRLWDVSEALIAAKA